MLGLRSTVFVLFGAVLCNVAVAQRDNGKPLNVLFIIADDLNNDLGAYGDPMVETPHIDAFAERSLRFDRAYCQYPLCNPSRVFMLSGLYPDQLTIYNNATPVRERFPDIVTLPQFFRNQGYFAARVGKLYHYGVPGDIGTNGLDDAASWDHVVNPIGRDKAEEDQIFSLRPGSYGGTMSWLAADGTDLEQTDGIGAMEAVRLLEAHKNEPFFLAVGFYRPHTPYVAPKAYFDRYPVENITPPTVPKTKEPAAAYMSEKPEHEHLTDALRREAIQAYSASITFMDAQVGRVLDALDELGLSENTIVVVTSDHGYHMGEHGLWKKQSLFEESARVPLFIHAPGMKAGGRGTEQLAELVDLYSTLVDLAGFTPPPHVAGVSLAPVLDNPAAPTKDVALTVQRRRVREDGETHEFLGRTIRSGPYRYTEWDGGARGIQLYNHENDPGEMNNLAGVPAFKELQATMRDKLRAAEARAAQRPKGL